MYTTVPYNFVKNPLTLYLIMHGLSQLVDSPTRKENILDIFATSRHSLVSKCMTIPGISDHEAVLIMSDASAKIQPLGVRKIFQWRKANFDNIKEKIVSVSFLSNYTYDHASGNYFMGQF